MTALGRSESVGFPSVRTDGRSVEGAPRSRRIARDRPLLYHARVLRPDPSATFLLRLLGAGVCWLLGAFPILAGLGLLETDKPIEPLAIPFAILFGLVFVALGAALVFHPLRALARSRGAKTWKQALTLGAGLLAARGNARSAGAAAGIGILGIACIANTAGASLPFLGNRATLASAVNIEFITIHAFPFLVVALGFATHARGAARAVSALVALMIATAYAVLAWAYGGGLIGLGWLVYLLVPNLLVFARADKSLESITLAISRWAIKFALFMMVAGIVGGGEQTAAATVAVGAGYFTLLALVELLRLPEVPLDLARAVARET
jgi:hypothetical protein